MKNLLTQLMSPLKSNERATTLTVNLMDFRLGVPMPVAAEVLREGVH